MSIEVRTATGVVRGRLDDGIAVFRGIPYAQPPSGRLRFRAPIRAEAWDGVRDATAFRPAPPQPPGVVAAPPEVSIDDYLTVNVWTPDPGASALPVMVWVRGGGFVAGASAGPSCDPETLCRDGGVVVVSMDYRTGTEGFAMIEGAPVNRGLLDLVLGLHWVRDNAVRFGGDPDRVTLYGQWAGAGCVMSLVSMPATDGLFRRVIAGSVPNLYFTPELAGLTSAAIARAAGRANTRDDLARCAPDELVAALGAVTARAGEHAERWGPVAAAGCLLGPVVDGDTLPADPWTAVSSVRTGRLPLLLGQARDESDWLFRMPTLRLAEAHAGPTHLYELATPEPGDDLRKRWARFARTGDPGWPMFEAAGRTAQVFEEPLPAPGPCPERADWAGHVFGPHRPVTRTAAAR
ncbi:carboxylesterase family protein [Nonomuraea sp. NBC_01738]|uniref:carboxylesterase family protein n=1 Tax=Nonomuraea sp. NBC_01738 TaxID=2976003 RepID=UPI002E125883|nr:carboxylesterase family protein [Nonomuraea sp. NBC_01738]